VTNKEAPAVAGETEMFPVDAASHEDSNSDDARTQISDSDESFINETDEVDSIEDHSNGVQLGAKLFSKLKRTTSIMMDRIPDVSDDLFDSSDENTEGPSTSKPEMALQRQRRSCYRPLSSSTAAEKEKYPECHCRHTYQETHQKLMKMSTWPLRRCSRSFANLFIRITIVGKRGRKVPVLLTPLMRESLDTLIEKREDCGVLKENGFLFALPHSVHYLRGSDCIRQFVHECDDIKNPKALTSTKLRKHIATLSTVLNLKTTELDQLADFLGHNIDVHRKHYRLPEGTLQLAKISKVLLALEQGQLGKYKGKSLDEIHIDLKETLDMEECSQEDVEARRSCSSHSFTSCERAED
ncbi:hypothetical protein L3Q82_019100, partial [Scortum barcoo]